MFREPILLVDCVGSAELYLNESKSDGDYFRGKFQEANRTNKNRRQYKFEALDRNMKNLMEAIKGKNLYGELDHASDSIIHLANASHLITNLWWESNILMGEGKILPTPSGRVLKGIIEAGGRIGISSRGVGNGTTDSQGVLIIDESYKLITFDVVADPSTFDAYQEKVSEPRKIKKETFEQKPAENPVRIEQAINPNAIVGLVGALIENHMNKIRKKI